MDISRICMGMGLMWFKGAHVVGLKMRAPFVKFQRIDLD